MKSNMLFTQPMLMLMLYPGLHLTRYLRTLRAARAKEEENKNIEENKKGSG